MAKEQISDRDVHLKHVGVLKKEGWAETLTSTWGLGPP